MIFIVYYSMPQGFVNHDHGEKNFCFSAQEGRRAGKGDQEGKTAPEPFGIGYFPLSDERKYSMITIRDTGVSLDTPVESGSLRREMGRKETRRMQTLLLLMAKIVILMGIGYFLRKKNLVTEEGQQSLAALLLNITLPMMMLAACQNAETTPEIQSDLLCMGLLMLGYFALVIPLTYGFCKLMHMQEEQKRVTLAMAVYPNAGFLGIPLAGEIAGPDPMMLAVVANLLYQPFFFSHGVAQFHREGSLLQALVKSPVCWTSLLAIGIFLSPLRFPDFFSDLFSTLGDMTVPLSMLIIGGSITKVRFREVFRDKQCYWITALRLVIIPLILIAIVKLLGIDNLAGKTIVLLGSLSSNTISVVYAEQAGFGEKLCAHALIQSTLLMILTVPVMLYLVGFYG